MGEILKKVKGRGNMNKMEELINSVKIGEFMKKQEQAEKKKNAVVCVFAVIGAIAAVAAIAFAVFKYFEPYYLEDFDDDDFDFDFDDEEDEDEEDDDIEESQPVEKKAEEVEEKTDDAE